MKLVVPKFPKQWDKLKPLPLSRGLCDTDGDRYPNMVDCDPFNSKKQGPLSWAIGKATGRTHDEVEYERKTGVKTYSEPRAKISRETYTEPKNKVGFIQTIKQKHQEYVAKAPERRAARLEKVKYETELYQAKQPMIQSRMAREREKLSLEKERLGIQRQRNTMQQERMKAMPAMPSMFGGFGGSTGGSTKPVHIPTMREAYGLAPITPAPGTRAKVVKHKKYRKHSKRKSSGSRKGKRRVVMYV